MIKRLLALTCVVAATTSLFASPSRAAHWSYEGEEGPTHWGDLSPDSLTCGSGKAQSPIDILSTTKQELTNPVFHYSPGQIKIINNGHTIQVTPDTGNYMEIDGARYDLVQFHFHAPSEHAVNGKLFDAEMHLVHKDGLGHLAVVGVLIKTGKENQALQSIWNHLPQQPGPEKVGPGTVDVAAILPSSAMTYRYDGSLTTPPCTEGVKWMVMKEPIELSKNQIAAYTKIFHRTNRPTQPMNGRVITEDTTP